MDRMEMAEKLREKANISMEEARDLLEQNNWDMLDAMVELEKQGKILKEEAAAEQKQETTDSTEGQKQSAEAETKTGKKRPHRLRAALKRAIRITLDNEFLITKNENVIVKVPVIVPILCCMASFWTTAIVLFIGLVFNLRYSLEGKAGSSAVNEKVNATVNRTMEKAGEFTSGMVDYMAEKEETAE